MTASECFRLQQDLDRGQKAGGMAILALSSLTPNLSVGRLLVNLASAAKLPVKPLIREETVSRHLTPMPESGSLLIDYLLEDCVNAQNRDPANVAGLTIARSTARQREIAVRMALGAVPARVVRQLLTEGVLLAMAGGALGLLAAHWSARSLAVFMSRAGFWPSQFVVHLDARVLASTAAVSMATGIVFGLAPAFRRTRFDLTRALKEKVGGGLAYFRFRAGGSRFHRTRFGPGAGHSSFADTVCGIDQTGLARSYGRTRRRAFAAVPGGNGAGAECRSPCGSRPVDSQHVAADPR
jgi:hypothetical protein